MDDVFIQLKNISKTFPGVHALDSVGFDVRKGEVHALIGENGAGKSTLIKVLSGVYVPDAGAEIVIEGKPFSSLTTRQSQRSGIVVIYQDFSLFPNLTVRENIAMTQILEKKKKFVNRRMMDQIAKMAIAELDIDIDLNSKLGRLSTAKQQLIAIARALVCNAKMIIMDEPTSALSKGEVEVLMNIVNKLKARGLAIMFVSHKLEELFRISDRMTILRDGKYVGTYETSELNTEKVIAHMVGRKVSFERMKGKDRGQKLLEVKSISRKGNFKDVSFALYAGEIISLTGLVGAGRTEVVRALFGLNLPDSGEIWLEGRSVMPKSPREAQRLGIAYVPENRQTEGLILRQDVARNATLSILDKFTGILPLLRFQKLYASGKEWIEKLDVRPNYPEMMAAKLSGGNQQKVVLAKWLATNPKILIIDEPTNGIDIGAKREIHILLRSLADEGIGIIMVSSELLEVLAISDRVLVMRHGRLVMEFNSDDATQESIMSYAVLKGKEAASE